MFGTTARLAVGVAFLHRHCWKNTTSAGSACYFTRAPAPAATTWSLQPWKRRTWKDSEPTEPCSSCCPGCYPLWDAPIGGCRRSIRQAVKSFSRARTTRRSLRTVHWDACFNVGHRLLSHRDPTNQHYSTAIANGRPTIFVATTRHHFGIHRLRRSVARTATHRTAALAFPWDPRVNRR